MASNYWDRVTRERVGRRRLLKSGAALSIGAAALALAGCGGDDDETASPTASGGTGAVATPTTSAAGQPQRGGTIGTYMTSGPGTYNAVKIYTEGYDNSGQHVYDRPITARLDNKRFNLEAMEKLELASPTKLVMTLKPNLVYHNIAPVSGRAVKASDIVATQKYVTDLPNAENSAFQRLYLDRAEAPDDRTVIYHLKQPTAYLYASIYLANPTAQPIIPQETLDNLDTAKPIGSGPYYLDSSTLDAEYKYKRFDKYRKANEPYFDARDVFMINDPVARETAFRGGRIHEYLALNSDVDRLIGELDKKKFSFVQYLGVGLTGFNAMMNFAKGGDRPWKDVRVREAFYRLTNRQQWIDLVFDSKAVVPPGPMQASLGEYQLAAKDTESYYKFDVAAAKQLLSAASYDTSKEWEVICITGTTNSQLGEVWQQQLSQGGIKVKVSPLPFAVHNPQRVQPALFDLFIGGQPGGDIPFRAVRNHASETGDQFSNVGLYDADIDALVKKSEETTDHDENVKLVKQIQMEALKKYSLSYIALTDQRWMFMDARLQNWEVDPLNGQNYETGAWLKQT